MKVNNRVRVWGSNILPECFHLVVCCNTICSLRDLLDSFQSLCSKPRQLARLFLDRVSRITIALTPDTRRDLLVVMQDFGLYTEYCTNYSKGNEYLEQSLANSSDLQTFILVNTTHIHTLRH